MTSLTIHNAKKAVVPNGTYKLLYNQKGAIVVLDDLEVGKIVYDKRRKPYKIRRIVYNGAVYTVEFFEDTLSTTFLMPLLGGYRSTYLWNKYFINAYYGDLESKVYPDQHILCLLFRDVGDRKFYDLEKRLIERKDYLGDNKPDKYHIQFFIDLSEYSEDFDLFVDGKYSQLSEATKQRILEFHNFGLKGTTASVMYQNPAMRKQMLENLDIHPSDVPEDIELYAKPSLKVEMYRPELKLLV